MGKTEILAELKKMKAEDRNAVFEGLCELQEADLLRGVGPTDSEKKLLDAELEAFQRDGKTGTPWREALAEISRSLRR